MSNSFPFLDILDDDYEIELTQQKTSRLCDLFEITMLIVEVLYDNSLLLKNGKLDS